ncbi:MAG: biosynthetic-type acetolactate synthase large subunit [Clostridia bacterium]|nr:biosynthetic-type acetolactate synthase large subunit [Clostridia bacterium]
MRLNGAKIITECLLEQGVDTVFGFPGGQIIETYDALYTYSDRIRHILTAHEQGAAHAADGYARASGRVGVVIATSGPGATNLVTGLATAYMDSVPVVAITGNVALQQLGRDSFQEVDIFGVTLPITKHNFIVRDVHTLADILRQAFRIAASGRPGPVLVDVPRDVQQAECDYQREPRREIAPDADRITEEDLSRAKAMLEAAERPVIFAGGGVIRANASAELRRFADRINAPVSMSLMGLGAYPASEKKCLGMLGMHGTKTSAKAVSEADLLIVCGARFSDRAIMKPNAIAEQLRVLHLDIDDAEINKNIVSHASIRGDLRVILEKLNNRIDSGPRTGWMARVEEIRTREPHTTKKALTPQALIDTVRMNVPDDTIIATDVGQHQMWVAQCYPFNHPRTLLTSGGLGTMGYGLGAAIGAQFAEPGRRVILFTGDGSFHMNMNELTTVSSNNLPIVIVIMNNGVLGMVRQWQKILYGQRYSQTTTGRTTNFVKLAEAFGIEGIRITEPAELKAAVPLAIANGRPAVIDVRIDKDECVYPMVAPGQSFTDPITSKEKQRSAK